MAGSLLDQQQPSLVVAVEAVYGREQARTLDQPWLEVSIDVKDEDEILRLEIATDRRMMSRAGAEDSLAVEIDDVASPRIVRASQMLAKLFFAQVAQHSDLAAGIGPRDIGKLIQR